MRAGNESAPFERWVVTTFGTSAFGLNRVTARVALNRLRTHRRRNEFSLVRAERAHARVAHPLDAMALRDALAQLPERLRAVFVLKEVEGFSHGEVADLLLISRGASEVRLHRAIRSRRRLLGTGQ